jgi:hypothetical protein
MKRIYSIMLIILLAVAPYVYAQMGRSSGGSMMGGEKGSMMSGQGHMEGRMQGHDMSGTMMHNLGQMSRLLQQMREMMADNPDGQRMSEMSGLMKDISDHILEMSKIMKRGSVTEQEKNMLHQHNRKMQEQYDKMRW